MTPQEIAAAFNVWKVTHEALRGQLTASERILVNEVCDYLATCAQAYEPVYPSGFPYSQDLKDSDVISAN